MQAKQAKYDRIVRANEVARKQADREAKVRAKQAKQAAYDDSGEDSFDSDNSDDDDVSLNP